MIEIVGGKAIAQDPPAGSFVSLLLEAREAIITASVTGQIDVETWGKTESSDRLNAISAEAAA